MKKLFIAILFILCLSFQASALGPMMSLSGMGTSGGGGEFTFIAYEFEDDSGGTSKTVTKPTGTTDGDIMIAFAARKYEETPTTTPAGWDSRGTNWNVDDYMHCQVWTRVASSEGANYTWEWANAVRQAIIIVTYRGGYDTVDEFDILSNTGYSGNDAVLRAAGVSVSEADSPAIFIGAGVSSTGLTYTPPSGFQEDADTGSTDSRFWVIAASDVLGSGASGDIDATISETLWGSKHAMMVVLTPQ